MANGPWNGSVVDSVTRHAVNQARITVTDSATDELIGLFADREGTKPIGNPFLTRPDGAVRFFARAGRVDIEAFYNGKKNIFPDEIIIDDWGSGPLCGLLPFSGVVSFHDSVDGTVNSFDAAPGEFIILYGVGNGPGLFPDFNISGVHDLTNVATDVGALYLAQADGGTVDVYLTNPGDVLAASASSITGLMDLPNQPEINASGFGHGILTELSAPTQCLYSVGFALIYSDGSFSTPVETGFDAIVGGSDIGWNVYKSNDYAISSQSISIGVGSGDIYGILISFRTSSFIETLTSIKTLTAGTDGNFNGFSDGNYGALVPDNSLFLDSYPSYTTTIVELDSVLADGVTYLYLSGNNVHGIPYVVDDLVALSINDGVTTTTFTSADSLDISPWTLPYYAFIPAATYTITLELKQRFS